MGEADAVILRCSPRRLSPGPCPDPRRRRIRTRRRFPPRASTRNRLAEPREEAMTETPLTIFWQTDPSFRNPEDDFAAAVLALEVRRNAFGVHTTTTIASR